MTLASQVAVKATGSVARSLALKNFPFLSGAAVDLLFDKGGYKLNNREVNIANIDNYHTRSSSRWVKDKNGVYQLLSSGQIAAMDGLGYDGRESVTNFVQDPLFNGAVVGVVGSGGAIPTGMVSGLGTAEIVSKTVKADGLTWLRVKMTYTNSTGVIQYPRWRFSQGNASVAGQVWRGQVFINVINTSHQITAMVEGSPYERVASQILVNGLQEINIGGAATATPATMAWIFGPSVNNGETWTAEFEFAAPQLISKAFGMPFSVGAVSADSIVIPAADAGMAIDPSVTGLTMFWRGRDFQATGPFAFLMEARLDLNNRATFFRESSTGRAALECRSSNTTTTNNTVNPAYDIERTILLTWRADGSIWSKFGSSAAVSASRPAMVGALTGLAIGNTVASAGPNNQITRRAGFMPTGLSDADALAVFNRLNEGL